MTRYIAIAKPEAFVRVVSRMSLPELDALGEAMSATGLTGREVVGSTCARAGQWQHIELVAVAE